MKINVKNIYYLTLAVYLCAMSSHNFNDRAFDRYVVPVTFVIFACVAGFMILSDGKVRITGFTVWYSLFAVFALSSCIWAQYSASYVFSSVNAFIQIIALSVLIPLSLKSDKDLITLLKIVVIALTYMSVLLIIRTPAEVWGGVGRSARIGDAISLHPNLVGTRMAVGVLINFFLIKMGEKKKIYIPLTVLFIALALFSGSKKAIIILLVGIVMIELLGSDSKNAIKLFKRLFLIIIGFSVLFYLIFHNSYLYNVLGSRLEVFINTVTGVEASDGSTIEREWLIELAKSVFYQYPILGCGLNNFQGYTGSIYSHNNYWELLSCLGIVGAALFYSMHLSIIINLIKRMFNRRTVTDVFAFTIMLLYIVCDYANVSYANIFQYVIILIVYLHVKYKKNQRPVKQGLPKGTVRA